MTRLVVSLVASGFDDEAEAEQYMSRLADLAMQASESEELGVAVCVLEVDDDETEGETIH